MAASITGMFTIVDRASGPMRRMESQAKKTMAAIEGVGAAQDKAAGGDVARRYAQHERTMRNVERATKGAGSATRGLGKDAGDTTRRVGGLTAGIVRLGAVLGSLRLILRVAIFSYLIQGVVLLLQAVGALAGGLVALVPRILDTVGALAALPAAIGAAVQGIGTLTLALGGVGDAVKQGMQLQQQAGRVAEDTADQHRAAADSIRNAERQLFLSQRSTRDAQRELTEARREAKRELIDMAMAARGAALSEARASLSLRQARESLARAAIEPGTSELDMASAQLSVREARFGLRQSRIDRARSRTDNRRAQARGVGGSDRMRMARRNLADAIYAQEEATRGLAEAQRDANRQMARGVGATDQYQQALADLSPEAQSFVKQLVGMRPAIMGLRAAAGRDLFPGLSLALSRSSSLLPVLRNNLQETGGVIGSHAAGFAADMTTPQRIGDVNALMRHQTGLVDDGGRAFRNIASAITDLMMAARPFTNWLSDTIVGWTDFWRETAAVGRETGRTREFLERTRQSLELFGRIAGNVWTTLRELFEAARPLGDRLWRGAEKATAGWAGYLETVEGSRKAERWFNKLYEPLHELGQLSRDLIELWGKLVIDESFPQTIRELRRGVPFLERLMLGMSSLGPDMAELLVEILRLLSNLPFQPLQLLVRALTRLLRIVNSLIERFPILGTVLSTLLTVGLISKIGTYILKIRSVRRIWDAIKNSVLGTAAAQKLLDLLPWRRGPRSPGAPVPGGGKPGALGRVGNFLRGPGGKMMLRGLGVVGAGAALTEFFLANNRDLPTEGGREINRAARNRPDPTVTSQEAFQRNMTGLPPTGDIPHMLMRPGEEAARRLFSQRHVPRAMRMRPQEGAAVRASVEKNYVDPHRKAARKTREIVADTNDRVTRNTREAMRDTADAITNNARKAEREAGASFGRLTAQAFSNLTKMGYSRGEARKLAQGNAAQQAAGKMASMFARGGRIRGAGLRDTVPVGGLAAPGELIVNRHTEQRVNQRLAAFNTTLGHEVGGEARPHSSPMRAAGRGPGGPHVFHQLGGRIPDAMGALPGLDVLAAFLKAKFGLGVSSGLRPGAITTSGNPSDHGWGGAIDVTNGITTPQMDAAHAWMSRNLGGAIKQMLYRTMVGGNHFDHIHVALQPQFAHNAGLMMRVLRSGGAMRLASMLGGLGIGGMQMKALRPGESALGGIPGALSGGAMRLMARGLTQAINRSLGFGGGMRGGAGTRGLNRIFPSHGLANATGHTQLTERQVRAVAESAGFSPGLALQMAQIARGESSYYPGIISWDGGHGLWQMTPRVWGASAIAKMNQLGGLAAMRNPMKNALMAKWLYDQAGGFSPWYGTKFLNTNMNVAGVQSVLNGAYGGRVAWGGWNQRGGRFRVNGPTIFGAGERGPEDVTISPKGQGGGGATSPTISVRIDHLEWKRDGDLKKAIRKELGELADELELVGSEPEDD